jgi:hypothetical protein
MGVTILSFGDDNSITNVSIHHRPLEAVLAVSAEFAARLKDTKFKNNFYVTAK